MRENEWNEYQKEKNILSCGTYDIYCGMPLKRDIAIILKNELVVVGELENVVLSVSENDIIYIKDNTTVRYDDICDIMLIEDYEKMKEGDWNINSKSTREHTE